ncbi:extracellular solute-binding protein [Clostridium sp. 19966]|uniref:extracellular solute-binding protein n=1 Tax=Clostridium sp. 19966 TaxID=2768166 RepID=UPI0028DE1FD1|nr:extracellular solute-binding protein [Clostridium sp. 19966]MDT8715666.1 extracellular solute-binding protein [Clostridium sp. 19966]
MLKRKKLFISLLTVVMLTSSLMMGCKKSDNSSAANDSAASSSSYPLKTDVTLTWWVGFSQIQGYGNIKTENDTEFAKELLKETGIKVKYVHPSGNDTSGALNLLIASGDLPDIIENDWYSFAGGPEAPINNGTTLKLNDLIDKYSPNLKAYLKKNPNLDKAVKTDSGTYYCYPFLRDDDKLTTYLGPIVRRDLLDKLGLESPTTIDEYENVLTKFKESGIKSPLTFDWGAIGWSSAFVGAYGVKPGLYVENGKVKFGQAEEGYKDFLTLMKKWYISGLLDKNFATLTGDQKATAMTSGNSGVSIGLGGGNMAAWQTNADKTGNGFKYEGAKYPVLEKGETPKFGQQDSRYTTYNAAAITTKCKYPEIAARLLDFGYSEKGAKLYNLGIEGKSYTMKDGNPTYTDTVLNNPDKIARSSVMANYTRYAGSPTIQQVLTQQLATPLQKAATETWKTDASKYNLPQISLKSDESSDAASIINGINTYVNEMSFKFIMGTEPLSNFDKYVDQLNKLGLQKYLKYNQDALNRYNKR